MVLRIRKNADNRIFTVYLLAMLVLLVVRFLMKVNVPTIVFLLVTLLPIFRGTTSEQLALVASCIPLSTAFQYKYTLLILAVAILVKNNWRLKWSGLLTLVLVMMVWEFWHALYGGFSYSEYLRGFAELLLLGIISSVELCDVDHKLVIRSLSVSVIGVCSVMLLMQMQQFNFDLIAVFARNAQNFRLGQGNMEVGRFDLNINANNLGFICNMATCGSLLLVIRKEHRWTDIAMIFGTIIYALMTLSRAAIICLVLILAGCLLFTSGKFVRKMAGIVGILVIAYLVLAIVNMLFPTVFENLTERFQQADILNGRGELFNGYNQFLLSSPRYLLFGVGMQQIFEKVVRHVPVSDVPHMGLQEVTVAWGLVGLILFSVVLWRVITVSKQYAKEKRHLYQFMPMVLIVVFTMSGQLLTSSRALMTLIFAYICLCIKKPVSEREENVEVV